MNLSFVPSPDTLWIRTVGLHDAFWYLCLLHSETAEPPLFPKVLKTGDGCALTYSSSPWRASPSCSYDPSTRQWSSEDTQVNATRVNRGPKPRERGQELCPPKNTLLSEPTINVMCPHRALSLCIKRYVIRFDTTFRFKEQQIVLSLNNIRNISTYFN